jgi:hypothetical protein
MRIKPDLCNTWLSGFSDKGYGMPQNKIEKFIKKSEKRLDIEHSML